MVSSSSTRRQRTTKPGDDGVDKSSLKKDQRTSAVSLVPGPKPLSKHHFYLDVKNHITSSKLESKIKNLGGILEVFLVRDIVTHVVTDREEWSSANRGVGSLPKTPQTPRRDVSLLPSLTPPLGGRPKTRAEAMLERARNTPTATNSRKNVADNDPLEQAKIWNIPVWSINKTNAWLSKVANSVRASKARQKAKVIELKAPYVKFEAFDRSQRPVFKEIRNWPSLFLKGRSSGVALIHAKEQQNMTKSSRPSPKKIHVDHTVPVTTVTQNRNVTAGYCEICREEFEIFKDHLKSEKHVAHGKDDGNFLQLDTLIHQAQTDLESFLLSKGLEYGLVDKPKNQLTNSAVQHKMPRTRTSSICDNKVKNAPISPTGSETKNRLRTRRSNMTYLALTANAEQSITVKPEGAKDTRELRSCNKKPDTWDSGRPKRACLVKPKRLSTDDPILLNEQRNFYKIDMTPKLRSSVSNNTTITYTNKEFIETSTTKKPLTPVPDLLETDKALIVKFRRMRTSELRQLNDEAENFLFPRKDDASSSEEDVDADCRDTTVSTAHEDTVDLGSEHDEHVDECGDAAGVGEGGASKKQPRRRLTHAEAFILDNKKYYKFETPGSRLRHHGAVTSTPENTRNNGDVIVNDNSVNDSVNNSVDKISEKVQNESQLIIGSNADEKGENEEKNLKFTLDELQFSFETVPKSEPWYETFSRQDRGAEYYTCFSDSGYWKPLLLPYEMDKIEPLDPKVCISTYTQIKKLLAEETGSGTGSNSGTCSTTDSSQPSPPPEMLDEENSKASLEETGGVVKEDAKAQFPKKMERKRGRRKRGILMPSKNPRKSPRQHASTLAILSSLIHNRKKRKSGNSSDNNKSLEAIQEQQQEENDEDETNSADDEGSKAVCSRLKAIANSIDDMLMNSFENLENLEISDVEDVLPLSGRSDAIEILQDYETHKHEARKTGLVGSSRRSYSPGKKPGRKKKKNRTGWPKNSVKRTLIGNLLNSGGSKYGVQQRLNAADDEESCTDVDIMDDSLNTTATSEQNNQKIDEFDQSNNIVVVNNSVVNSVNNDNADDRVTNNGSVVDLDKWENAEKVLAAKITNDVVANDSQFQPIVRVEKLNTRDDVKLNNRKLRSSVSPHRTSAKRARRMPASPRSPRVLRKPRGRWYRER